MCRSRFDSRPNFSHLYMKATSRFCGGVVKGVSILTRREKGAHLTHDEARLLSTRITSSRFGLCLILALFVALRPTVLFSVGQRPDRRDPDRMNALPNVTDLDGVDKLGERSLHDVLDGVDCEGEKSALGQQHLVRLDGDAPTDANRSGLIVPQMPSMKALSHSADSTKGGECSLARARWIRQRSPSASF